MVDHLRGWYRGKKLIAFTVEPYHEVDADAFRAAAPALAEDDLVMSVCSCCAVHHPGQTLAVIVTRKENGQPIHLINRQVAVAIARSASSRRAAAWSVATRAGSSVCW
jgi:hypothetical protein